jgi:protein-disulfide isomerase
VRCAGDQNKYWELRDSLYANAAPPNEEVIKKSVESLSLDEKGFQACMDSDKYKADGHPPPKTNWFCPPRSR